MVLIHAVKDPLDHLPPQGAHRFTQPPQEFEPVDQAILVKCLGEQLEVVFFEEDSVGVEGLG